MGIPDPVIAAGGSIAEGLIGSAFNAWQAERARDYNREMASTAHQREVKDLKKAGLNPILSAGGSGAHVAPSPTAHAVSTDATGKALMASLQQAQIRDINSSATLKDAQAKALGETTPVTIEKMRTEIADILRSSNLKGAQVNEIAQRIDQSLAQIKLIGEQAKTEEARALREKALKVLWQNLEKLLNKGDATIKEKIPGIWEKIKSWVPINPGPENWPHSAKELEGR